MRSCSNTPLSLEWSQGLCNSQKKKQLKHEEMLCYTDSGTSIWCGYGFVCKCQVHPISILMTWGYDKIFKFLRISPLLALKKWNLHSASKPFMYNGKELFMVNSTNKIRFLCECPIKCAGHGFHALIQVSSDGHGYFIQLHRRKVESIIKMMPFYLSKEKANSHLQGL